MSSLHRVFRVLTVSYTCLVLFVLTGVVGLGKVSHMRLLSVQTGSMAPTFRPGDAVLVSPVHTLHPGMMVSYVSPISGELISHRIVAVDADHGQLTTKGDHERKIDTPIGRSTITGREVLLLPGFGKVLKFLRSPLGRSLFLYLPALAIVMGEIRRLASHYRRGYYRLLSFR